MQHDLFSLFVKLTKTFNKKPVCVTTRIYTHYATIQGLLNPIQTPEASKAHSRNPEPSATRHAPRAFSTGVVDSLGWGFVLNLISELNALLDRFALICLSSCYEKDYFSY